MNYLMLKMLGLLPMNEAGADGSGTGGAAPAADAAQPAAAPAADQAAAPAAEGGSLLGELAKPESEKPADAAEPEANAEGDKAKQSGVPETYEFKLPDGEELDEKALPMVQDLFKELGLPQDKAQAVLDKLLEIDKARQPTPEQIDQMQAEGIQKLNKQWADECAKLEGIGGDNFQKSLEVTSKVMVKFASPELREMLNQSALGSNPEFFKFIHAIGSAMSQDTLEHGGDAGKGPRSIESKMWPAMT